MRRRSSRHTATSTSWCAAIASPTGPRAGAEERHQPAVGRRDRQGGFDALALHWDVMEQRAPEFGHTPDRGKWRLCGPMHLAETKEQAIEDVRFGLDAWCDYTQDVLAAPHFRAAGKTFEERVAWVNETGLGRDRHPGRSRRPDRTSGEAVRRLRLLPAHPPRVGPHAATLRSYELFANYVKPKLPGQHSAGWRRPPSTPGPAGAELDKRQGDANNSVPASSRTASRHPPR